jgi:xanthine dehydrogenase accessory factor
MRSDLLVLASDLIRRGEAFALAIVVRREPASSAQAGDMALITEDGAFHGWLGGSCTQPTVVQEARRAIAEGVPRLLALSPDPPSDLRPGVVAFPMTCHSGGTVDIYLEPVLPPPRLVVLGASPAAQALVRLGKTLGYAVDAVDPAADSKAFPDADRVITDLQAPELAEQQPAWRRFVVVATMGQRDEEATLAALALEPAYLGVVASRKRFAQIRATALARGASEEALARIKNPAGLDIGAHTPDEIALSILAEIVHERRAAEVEREAETAPTEGLAEGHQRDPICGMTVEVAGAAQVAEFEGRTYYFCCGGCRERFLAEPQRYAAAQAGGAG